MPRMSLGGKPVDPKSLCSIEQAVEIAIRVSRRELLRASSLDPDHPTFEQYINGPANSDALPVIQVMVQEYVERTRLSVRLRTWLDLHLPRFLVRR